MPPSVNFLGHWSQVNSFPLLWLLLCISKWQNNENNIGHLITRCKVLWKCRKMPPILDYKNPEVSEKCHWFFTETPLKCRFFGKKDSPENAADFFIFLCRTFWSMVINKQMTTKVATANFVRKKIISFKSSQLIYWRNDLWILTLYKSASKNIPPFFRGNQIMADRGTFLHTSKKTLITFFSL